MQIIPTQTPCKTEAPATSPWSGVNSGGDGLARDGEQQRCHHNLQHERHARIGHTVNDGQHEEREDVLHFIGRGRSAAGGLRGHDQRE